MTTILVFGNPAPQGSKKFVGMNKQGRGIMVESSKKVRPWRQDVKAAAEAVRGSAEPIDEPIRVRMVFTLPKPMSAPKTRRTFPSKKPDLSKLVRSTEDALTDAGIWRDDSRVVECVARKVFPNEDEESLSAPGVRIVIEVIAEQVAKAA
jgi:Holliday junction resolvase RusA-like endonuclease